MPDVPVVNIASLLALLLAITLFLYVIVRWFRCVSDEIRFSPVILLDPADIMAERRKYGKKTFDAMHPYQKLIE